MATPKGAHMLAIPEYLWEALDRTAAFHNVPTNRMIAQWLWEHARKHADNPDLPRDLADDLLALVRPYDRGMRGDREYPRRPAHASERHE